MLRFLPGSPKNSRELSRLVRERCSIARGPAILCISRGPRFMNGKRLRTGRMGRGTRVDPGSRLNSTRAGVRFRAGSGGPAGELPIGPGPRMPFRSNKGQGQPLHLTPKYGFAGEISRRSPGKGRIDPRETCDGGSRSAAMTITSAERFSSARACGGVLRRAPPRRARVSGVSPGEANPRNAFLACDPVLRRTETEKIELPRSRDLDEIKT